MTTRGTSALLVVDMQNDFLAKGGYYAEKAKRAYNAGGELTETDQHALACVYLHPPPACEISDKYQEFVRTVTEVADTALNAGALAGKVSGAGGGGFVMFVVDPDRRAMLNRAVTARGFITTSARFTNDGCAIWESH